MKLSSLEVLFCDGGWRDFIFVKGVSDNCIGWSEVTDSHGSPKGLKAVIEDLSSLVVGRDIAPERTYWDLYQATRQTPGGLIAKAIGGIENCLWDLKGKELGVPVYELLGGPTRETVPCYWSHCGTTRARAWEVTKTQKLDSYERVMDLAVEVENRGFSALKTNIVIPGKNPLVLHPGFGGGPADGNVTPDLLDNMRALISAFKQANVEVILDLNFNFKPESVIRIAEELDDLLWLEVDSYSPEALAYIRSKVKVPITTGENLYGCQRALAYMKSCDLLSIDLPWNGLSQAKKMADMAQAHELNITPHNYYSHLATFMSANLCATIPNVRMLEVDVDDVPWKDELTDAPQIDNGYLSVLKTPGWGCDVDEKVLRKHQGRH